MINLGCFTMFNYFTLDDICTVGNKGAIITLLSEDPPLPPPPQETTKRAIRIELKNLIYD